MDILLEGVRASVQPCSLAIGIPALGVALLGGRRGWLAASALLMSTVLLAWAQAALLIERGDGLPFGLALAATTALGIILLGWADRLRGRPGSTGGRRWSTPARALAGGASIGVVTGLVWQPCVGAALGQVLSSAPTDPAGQLLPLGAHLLGILLPAVAVAALPWLGERPAAVISHPAGRLVGVVPLLALLLVCASGRYEQLIGALVRASTLT